LPTFTTDAFGDVTSVDNHGGETGGTANVPRVVLNATFDANSNRTALNAAIGSGTGTADFQDSMAFDYLNRQTSIVQAERQRRQHRGANKGTFYFSKRKSRRSRMSPFSAFLFPPLISCWPDSEAPEGRRMPDVGWKLLRDALLRIGEPA
jgi:hypothetical protein